MALAPRGPAASRNAVSKRSRNGETAGSAKWMEHVTGDAALARFEMMGLPPAGVPEGFHWRRGRSAPVWVQDSPAWPRNRPPVRQGSVEARHLRGRLATVSAWAACAAVVAGVVPIGWSRLLEQPAPR